MPQYIILLPLFALIAPFVLWPIELFLPFPHIIEELLKALCVFLLLPLPSRKNQFLLALLVGGLFSISESILYVFNLILVGTVHTVFLRLLCTTLLHIGTLVLMLSLSTINKRLLFVGVILSILVHFWYNQFVGGVFFK